MLRLAGTLICALTNTWPERGMCASRQTRAVSGGMLSSARSPVRNRMGILHRPTERNCLMNTPDTDRLSNITDQAAQGTEHAIRAAQHAANEALATLANTMESLRKQASPWLSQSGDDLGNLAQRGLDRANHAAHRLQTRALQASSDVEHLIVKDPLKAVLVAAASGAALMALLTLVTRSTRDN